MWLCKSKKSIEKMDKCPNYQNNGYLDAHLKKEEKKEIAHVVLQSHFQVLKRGMFSRSKSRIRLATIYIHLPPHIHTHAHLDLIVRLVSLDPLFDFTIYALQVCMCCLYP
jgi:hypothetical protein